jgi:uncharacterized protein (TIGR02099 family)
VQCFIAWTGILLNVLKTVPASDKLIKPPLVKRVWLIAAFVIILLLALAGATFRWVLWPELQRWQPQVEAQMSKALGSKVTVGGIRPGFSGLHPMLTVTDIRTAQGEIVLEQVDMEVSPRALMTKKLLFHNLSLKSGRIQIKVDEQGLWHIAGLVFNPKESTTLSAETERQLIEAVNWVFDQRKIQLSNIDIVLSNAPLNRTDALRLQDVGLENSGNVHRLALKSLPGGTIFAQWRKPNDVKSHLVAQWQGNVEWLIRGAKDADALSGDLLAYLLKITDAVKNQPVLEQLAGLALSGDLSAKFSKGILDEAQLTKSALTSQPLQVRLDGQTLSLKRIKGQDFELSTNGLRLAGFDELKEFSASTTGVSKLGFHWGSERLDTDSAAIVSAELALGPIRLAPLRKTLQHWANAQSVVDLKRFSGEYGLNAWQLQGSLNAAKLQWSDAQGALSGELDAAGLSLLASGEQRPGFDGLAGRLTFSRASATDDLTGRYELKGTNARLVLPGVLVEQQIALEQLDSAGAWRWFKNVKSDDQYAVELNAERLSFTNKDAKGELSGLYRSSREPSNPGFIDMQGSFSRANGLQIARYLPLQISEGVRNWVSNAIQAGDAKDGKFRVKGELLKFPFLQAADGEFKISAKISDAKLMYAPDWPTVDRIDGDLVIERDGLRIDGRSAEILGVALSNVQVELAEFRQGVVKIEGAAKGSVAKMLDYVNVSPLKNLTLESPQSAVKEFMSSLKVDGDGELNLKLVLPILNMSDLRVNGQVKLNGGTFKSIHTPDLTQFGGTLKFDEQGLAFEAMQGDYEMGGRLAVDGVSNKTNPLSLKLSGVATSSALQSLPFLQGLAPILPALDGASAFQSTLDIVGGELQVGLQSDLDGVAVNLPFPAGKDYGVKRPLNLAYSSRAIGMKLGEGNDPAGVPIALMLKRRTLGSESPWEGGVGVGLNEADTVPIGQGGVAALVKVPRLDATAWRNWLKTTFPISASTNRPGQTQADPIIGLPAFVMNGSVLAVTQAAVVAEVVTFEDIEIKWLTAGMSFDWQKTSNGLPLLIGWAASSTSDKADGFVQWKANGRESDVLVRMDNLAWPLNYPLRPGVAKVSTPLVALPSVDLEVAKFEYRGLALGSLTLRGTGLASNASYKVDSLTLAKNGYQIDADLDWDKQSNTSNVRLKTKLTSLGVAFESLGYPEVFKSTAGSLNGNLRWQGRPDKVEINDVSGDMLLNLGQGQFLKTDVGAARILPLISAQGLLRRLNLDFRDVTDKGFSFDSVQGPIRVNSGVALMDNVVIKSSLAQVTFKGNLGLEERTQNLRVRVLPEVNAGGASIAYAAIVNPALGLGSFLLQFLLRRPLQEIFAVEYDVTGKWDQPIVKEYRKPPKTVAQQREP